MSEGQLISLVVIAGCLTLSLAGLRRKELGARKTLGMVLLWAGIIGIVALVFETMQ